MTTVEQLQLDNIAKNDYQIYPLLKQRYSPRIFSTQKLTEKDVNRLFESIRWSASCYNWQPWRFIYAHKGSDGYTSIMECLSEFNQKWARNAPFLMLAAYKKNTPEGDENFHALHDLGLSLGNLTVQAEYMGIGLHHMAGVDWKKAQKVFDVPEGFHIATAIAVGYYGGDLNELPKDLQEQEKAERTRIPQEDFAFEGSWK
ncbi:nitroreductase family protein [Maribacter sp. 4G9]|uniref:nitroreductase family protein n=1 Tax=Maribacter sp. 4G9 TaxID=1889777 RepID=UPI000C149A38|nr:nitroreductase family protein [Maribacter sp. 4G9]PIB25759.1 nitroreductase [Maribacter sp. 4G9]